MSIPNTYKANHIDLQNELTGPLQTRWAGQPVCVYETIDSTNAEATRLAGEGASHGTLVTAKMQTAGRGRRGRSWESPPGDNLYFSLLLKPKLPPEKAPMLTLVMAVSVARAIEALTGLHAEIKWPNDLVVNGKKVCGILTEMRMAGTQIDHVVIGVGVNVKGRNFSGELEDKATALETALGETDKTISGRELLQAVLEDFETTYEAFVEAGDLTPILQEYHKLLVNCDREVTVLDPQGAYTGVARGITKTGELIVELPDGMCKKVYAGEVSVRGVYGYV